MPHRKLEIENGNRTPNCLRHHVWLDVSTFNKCLFTTKQGGFLLILICETSQIFVWRNKAFIFFQKSDINFKWVQPATDMHPACPNKKQNHLQNSLLRRTQFWVRKTFSKPASLKRASLVALPVAISHKVSLKPKLCASATLIQKTSKNEPKHGPKNGTAWRSHFWDRMHSLVKEQKKSTFTVPFLGPSGGTKNETAKSQNPQQRPSLATNKKLQLHLFKQPAYRFGTEEARTCEA